MSATAVAVPAAVTFVTGGGLIGVLQWWQNRRNGRVTASTAEVENAARVNTIALSTLDRVQAEAKEAREEMRAEVLAMKDRLTKVELEAAQNRIELDETRREHFRIAGLFQQALTALREFLDIAVSHSTPKPRFSAELQAELAV